MSSNLYINCINPGRIKINPNVFPIRWTIVNGKPNKYVAQKVSIVPNILKAPIKVDRMS